MKHGYTVDLVHRADNLVGECPLWNVRERALYWVDTRRALLQRLNSDGSVRVWELPHKIGSFVFRERGGLIAAMQSGVCELASATATAGSGAAHAM